MWCTRVDQEIFLSMATSKLTVFGFVKIEFIEQNFIIFILFDVTNFFLSSYFSAPAYLNTI